MNKNIIRNLGFIFVVVSLMILFLEFSSAVETNVCCEKTIAGAWCQNAEESYCDDNYLVTPTSCSSTSYCNPGCCFDSQEGICWENTPQRVCLEKNGTWADDSECNVRQCNLGCCVLGDQASFVTMTRCKSMAGFYGLEIDYRPDVENEVACIAIANSKDKGACVFEGEYGELACTFGTREECSEEEQTLSSNESDFTNESKFGFYKNILCSSEKLGTVCGPSTETTVLGDKDEVYYLDTCGNTANIYDSSKYNDDDYWHRVYKKEESCGYGESNAESETCGNCDYFLGSIGKEASRFSSPVYGSYICKDLGCGELKHGESVCIKDEPSGEGLDTVGSRHFRKLCVNNEIIIEPCADFRNQICYEETTNGFSEARCSVNRWQDCLYQKEQDDCENNDLRDCRWINNYVLSDTGNGITLINYTDPISGESSGGDGLCVPLYPPGLNFWGGTAGSSIISGNSERFSSSDSSGFVSSSPTTGTANGVCSYGNSIMTVQFKGKYKSFSDAIGQIGDEDKTLEWKCLNNDGLCEMIGDEYPGDVDPSGLDGWVKDMNSVCVSLGDCGGYVSWVGVSTDEGYAAYWNNTRFAGSGGSKTISSSSTTRSSSSVGTSSGNSGTSLTDIDPNAASSLGSIASGLSGDNSKDSITDSTGDSIIGFFVGLREILIKLIGGLF